MNDNQNMVIHSHNSFIVLLSMHSVQKIEFCQKLILPYLCGAIVNWQIGRISICNEERQTFSQYQC